jgi:hypothetical protein
LINSIPAAKFMKLRLSEFSTCAAVPQRQRSCRPGNTIPRGTPALSAKLIVGFRSTSFRAALHCYSHPRLLKVVRRRDLALVRATTVLFADFVAPVGINGPGYLISCQFHVESTKLLEQPSNHLTRGGNPEPNPTSRQTETPHSHVEPCGCQIDRKLS